MKNGGKRMMIRIRLDQGEGRKMLNKKEMKGFFFFHRNKRLRYKKCERKVFEKEGKVQKNRKREIREFKDVQTLLENG